MELSLIKKKYFRNNYSIFCFFLFFLIEFFISYCQIFKGYPSDLLYHIMIISKIGTLNFPEMGFEYTIFILSKVTGIEFQWTAIFVLSLIMGTQALFIYYLFDKLTKIENYKTFLFSIIAMTCGAIYLPFFNRALPFHHFPEKLSGYLTRHPHSIISGNTITMVAKFFGHYTLFGIESPNIWHNPTYIVIRIIALGIIYLYLTQKKQEQLWSISILLGISCFYKPSFATIFIPAVFIYEFIQNKNTLIKTIQRISIIILPTIMILGTMFYMLTFVYKTPHGQTSHIIFAPLGVIHLYVKNELGALFEALAFPILILLLRHKEIFTYNKFLLFSWIMLFFGYIYWALLAQSGSDFYGAGNFGWGYNLGLFFVFTFSIVEYIRFSIQRSQEKYLKILFFIATGLLFLHFFWGLAYLVRVLLGFSLF